MDGIVKYKRYSLLDRFVVQHPLDASEIVAQNDVAEIKKLFQTLTVGSKKILLENLNAHIAAQCLLTLAQNEITKLANVLDPKVIIRIISLLPAQESALVLNVLEPNKRADLLDILNYPEKTALA